MHWDVGYSHLRKTCDGFSAGKFILMKKKIDIEDSIHVLYYYNTSITFNLFLYIKLQSIIIVNDYASSV